MPFLCQCQHPPSQLYPTAAYPQGSSGAGVRVGLTPLAPRILHVLKTWLLPKGKEDSYGLVVPPGKLSYLHVS